MNLNINIDNGSYALEVADALVEELKPVFADMDAEYDRGIQLGRFWIDEPTDEQRCQLSVNKLVNAMYGEDKRTLYIMAAYVVYKFPNVKAVHSNSDLEIHEIDIETE